MARLWGGPYCPKRGSQPCSLSKSYILCSCFCLKWERKAPLVLYSSFSISQWLMVRTLAKENPFAYMFCLVQILVHVPHFLEARLSKRIQDILRRGFSCSSLLNCSIMCKLLNIFFHKTSCFGSPDVDTILWETVIKVPAPIQAKKIVFPLDVSHPSEHSDW